MGFRLMTVQSYVGAGFETTPGTGVVPSYYFPCDSPAWTPNVTWLEDKGMRGSPTELYSRQAGVRHDTFDFKGFAFLDTFPYMLRAMYGAADSVVSAPTSTTLSSSAVAGATSVSTVATIPTGSAIIIGTGVTAETHITGVPSGSGPFTIPLVTPGVLLHNQTSGAVVAGLTAHTLGLENNVATGSQPPSSTISYFDAGAAGTTTARGLTYAMLDKLSLTFAANGGLEYTAAWITQAEADLSAPTPSFSSEIYVPAWACSVTLGGTTFALIEAGTLDIQRGAQVINTLGSQSPYAIFDGPIILNGKITFVLEVGSPIMAQGTLRHPQTLDLTFYEPTSGHLLDVHMNQIQLYDVKQTTGKAYLEVEGSFGPEGNTTDATMGGYSPSLVKVANSTSTAY